MTGEMVSAASKLGFRELVRGDVRLWESGRAQSVREGWQEMYGVDVEAFLADHEARSKTWRFREGDRRKDYGNGREPAPSAWAGWGERFSYLDLECDFNRLILIDTCERRLLLESKDVRAIIEPEPLSAVTLRLWREAALSSDGAVVAQAAVRVLLDELERLSMTLVFHENGVDCGKFL